MAGRNFVLAAFFQAPIYRVAPCLEYAAGQSEKQRPHVYVQSCPLMLMAAGVGNVPFLNLLKLSCTIGKKSHNINKQERTLLHSGTISVHSALWVWGWTIYKERMVPLPFSRALRHSLNTCLFLVWHLA